MCNVFEEFGKEMREEGLREGKRETLLSKLKTLMETLHLSEEQAMNALRIPDEARADLKNGIAVS